MTANEMAKEFLDLLQKTSSGAAPSLEDFEISYALSTAEEELIKTRYSHKSNSKREGFENSEKRRKDLSQLVANKVLYAQDINDSSFFVSVDNKPNGSFWYLPENLLWVIEEEIVWNDNDCYEDVRIEVKPLEHDKYNTVVRNSFLKPYKHLVYRLDYNSEFGVNSDSHMKIVGNPLYSFNAGGCLFTFNSSTYGQIITTIDATSVIEMLTSLSNFLKLNYPLLTVDLYTAFSSISISDKKGGSLTVEIEEQGGSNILSVELFSAQVHELITHGWSIKEYHLRYIKRPDGIVVDFSTKSNQKHSVLNPIVHREIIFLAVKNTLASLEDPRYNVISQDSHIKE